MIIIENALFYYDCPIWHSFNKENDLNPYINVI